MDFRPTDGGNVKMRLADGPAKPSFLPRLGPKTIGLLWVARIGAAGAAFLTQILLGRGLGLEGYGVLVTSLALVSFLLPLAGFGVPVFWLRVFGKEGQSARRWLRPTLILVAESSVVVAVVAILLAFVVDLPSTSRTLVLVLSIMIRSPAGIALRRVGGMLRASLLRPVPHCRGGRSVGGFTLCRRCRVLCDGDRNCLSLRTGAAPHGEAPASRKQ